MSDEPIFPVEPCAPDELGAEPALPAEPPLEPAPTASAESPLLVCARALMGGFEPAATALAALLGVSLVRRASLSVLLLHYHLAVRAPRGYLRAGLREGDARPVLALCHLSPLRRQRGRGWSVWATEATLEQLPEDPTPAHVLATALLTAEQLLQEVRDNRAQLLGEMD